MWECLCYFAWHLNKFRNYRYVDVSDNKPSAASCLTGVSTLYVAPLLCSLCSQYCYTTWFMGRWILCKYCVNCASSDHIMVESCRSQNNYTGFCHWKRSAETVYGMDDSLRAIWNKNNNVSTIYIISPHRHDTCGWNAFSCKTKTYLFYIVNSMGADGLGRRGHQQPWYWLCWPRIIPSCTLRVKGLYIKLWI